MADRSRSLEVLFGANVTGFVGAVGVAKQSALGFAREAGTAFQKNAAALDTVSNSAAKVGASLTALAGFAVKSAMDWESAWTGVLKTVEGTPAQLALVEQGLRDLATSMPESHQNIAAVAEAAGQLGVQRESIVEFTKTMVMLGDTTNLTAEQAATSIAQLMNVMGTQANEVDNLGSALVALGNDGASTEAQIIDMAQRIAGAGRIVGLTEANVLALSNAVASTGVEAELGGTAISQVLVKITREVATNSAALNTWASAAGMSAKEFAAAWGEDPAEVLVALSAGLDEMGKSSFEFFDQVGLEGQRVQQVLLNLAGANDMLADSFRTGDQSWQQNLALVKEAEKRYDTTAAKAEIAWNQIKDAGIDAGQGLLPVVSALVGGIGDLASAFGTLPDELQSLATGLTGLGGVSLLAFAGITKLTAGYTANRLAMLELQAAAPLTAAAVGRVAMAARLAAIALGALFAANELGKLGAADQASVAAYTKQLIGIAQGSKAARAELEKLTSFEPGTFNMSSVPITGLKDAFEQADSTMSRWMGKFPGFNSSAETASKSIGQIDQALTSLVQSGAADDAAASFEYLQQVTGQSKSELLDNLPLYEEALAGVAAESDKTVRAFEDLSGGSDALAMRLAQLSSDPEEAAKKFAEMTQATAEAGQSFVDFTAELENTGAAFDTWMENLEKGVKAQEAWADNLIKATARGVPEGLIKQLEEAGPQAATLLDGIANSSEEELARIIDAFEQTGDSAAQVLNRIPPEIVTLFDIRGADNAIAVAAQVANQYDITPRDVQTILKALDWASPDIKAVMAKLAEYEKTNPSTTVDIDTDGALEKIRIAKAAAASLFDLLSNLPGAGGGGSSRRGRRGSRDADGSIRDGAGVQMFAFGGFSEDHAAMIAPGGPVRFWAEPETGGEAYIPLAPSKHDRSTAIWEETGRRLGVFDSFDQSYQAAAQSYRTREIAASSIGGGTTELARVLTDALAGQSGSTFNLNTQVQGNDLNLNQLAELVGERIMFKIRQAGL